MTRGSDAERAFARENERRRARGLERRRATEAIGSDRVDFVSSDFLGLALDPRLADAARTFGHEHGAGALASRLLGGAAAASRLAEEAFLEWQGGAGDALLFPSGFQANLSVLPVLAGRGDVFLSDALCHASLIDGMRLSRATVQVHRHLDLAHLEERLVRARDARRRVVVTESVFSMDGDGADLPALAELCRRHDAWLYVDEAHAGGVLGPFGRGACAAVEDAFEDVSLVRVVTGGKALGVAGAFVAAGPETIAALYQLAHGNVYSTGVSPLVAGALVEAIRLVADADARRARLFEVRDRLCAGLGVAPGVAAIVPYVVGAADATMRLAADLAEAGFDVRGVRPPTVPEGTSRLRLVAHADHLDDEVDHLVAWLRKLEPARPEVVEVAPARPAPLFVVGTDTDAGKTVASAMLMRVARRLGPARYFKPVQTGDDSDTRTVAALAELPAVELTDPIYHFAKPASPHEAARAEDATLERAVLDEGYLRFAAGLGDARAVVELAGGLLVPYDHDGYDQSDFLVEHARALVLVARSGLGTLNHTRLTLEALERRGLRPRALILVGDAHPSNRATLAPLVERVVELPRFTELSAAVLDAWVADEFEAQRLAELLP